MHSQVVRVPVFRQDLIAHNAPVIGAVTMSGVFVVFAGCIELIATRWTMKSIAILEALESPRLMPTIQVEMSSLGHTWTSVATLSKLDLEAAIRACLLDCACLLTAELTPICDFDI